MAGSQKDIPNSQPVPTNAQKEANVYKDEINLIDYFTVLWKRKYIIILCSVLPALVVGLITFSRPRDYKMIYLYDIGLYERSAGIGEKDYKMLLDRFYSAENLDRLTFKLRENGLDKYAQKVAGAATDEALKKLVDFEVSPSYFEIASTTDIQDLQEIQQVKGTLLAMTITGRPQKDMHRISSIMRDDFEKVIPIYTVKHELNKTIANFKADMANIEENRYGLELELERKKTTLAKLKNLEPKDLDKIPSDIVLQFNNVGGNSEYLPLAYQIQAADANIINLEESIRANQEMYDYYKGLLSLNEGLFNQVRNKTSPYYTIQEFRSFLANVVNDYQDKELIDYLNAYIKRIENIISANIPVMEKPKVYPVAKGTVKKSAIVLVIAFVLSVFAAFLLEGLRKSQAHTS